MEKPIMRKVTLSLAIIAVALPFLAAAPAQAQNPRTWVSGVGDDLSPTCSRAAPCKTFAAAIAVTNAGGEINCVDSGGFGTLTITKAITVACEVGTAGVLGTGGGSASAILINAATTDVVTLRGLDIDGQATTGYGIAIATAKEVHIENCSIRNFRGNVIAAGIWTTASSSTTVFLYVEDTVISDNQFGVLLSSSGGFKVASLKDVTITGSVSDGLNLNNTNVFANVTESIISANGGSAVNTAASSTTANVDHTTIANNGVALNAAVSGSTIRASFNNIFNNTTGFSIAGGAFIQSDSSNLTGGSNGGATTPNAPLTKN
jgi:hypothetical protein